MGGAASALKRLTRYRGKAGEGTAVQPSVVHPEVQAPSQQKPGTQNGNPIVAALPSSPAEDGDRKDHENRDNGERPVSTQLRTKPTPASTSQVSQPNGDLHKHHSPEPTFEEDTSPPDKLLEPPHPWVRVPYEDDAYYWNTETDEVTWEFPAEAPTASCSSAREEKGLAATQVPVEGLDSDEDDDEDLMGVLDACREAKAGHEPRAEHLKADRASAGIEQTAESSLPPESTAASGLLEASGSQANAKDGEAGLLEEHEAFKSQSSASSATGRAYSTECDSQPGHRDGSSEMEPNFLPPQFEGRSPPSCNQGASPSHRIATTAEELETVRHHGSEPTHAAGDVEKPLTQRESQQGFDDQRISSPAATADARPDALPSSPFEISPVSALVLPAGRRVPAELASRASQFYELVKMRQDQHCSTEGPHSFFDTYRILRQPGRGSGPPLEVEVSPAASPLDSLERSGDGLVTSARRPRRQAPPWDYETQPPKRSLPSSAPALLEATSQVKKDAVAKPKSAFSKPAKSVPKTVLNPVPKRRRATTPARARADAALVAVYTGRACERSCPLHSRPKWQ